MTYTSIMWPIKVHRIFEEDALHKNKINDEEDV